MTFAQKLFGFHGRLRRRDFWLLFILMIGASAALAFAVRRGLGLAPDDPWMDALNLVTAWPMTAIAVKRLHDRDRSGWLVIIIWAQTAVSMLAALYPGSRLQVIAQVLFGLVQLWMLVDLGILDGTKGPNRYGPSPKGIGRPTDAELDEVFA